MSNPSPTESFTIETPPSRDRSGFSPLDLLKPLASLKLTVVLFALSILLVLAGTLAQVDKDIWDVVREYFRCWMTWIEVRSFAPLFNPLTGFLVDHSVAGGSFLDLSKVSPQVRFPFPGGNTIGALMLINLVAAHSVKFTMQAKGSRAAAGGILTLIGALVTWLVIQSGHADTSVQDALISWDRLWLLVEVALVVLGCVNAVAVGKAHQQRKPELVPLLISLGFVVAALGLMFSQGGRGIDDSGMRILWQLIKGIFAGVVLLAGCTLLFKKRAGVVVLHSGVILMLIHEPIVGTFHLETQMSIEEGKVVNFAEDIRTVELVFSDTSHAEYDDVVSVPKKFLTKSADPESGMTFEVRIWNAFLKFWTKPVDSETTISNPQLPFDIEVVKFLQNSNPGELKPGTENLATAGVGLATVAEDVAAGTGTDSGGAVDLTAAYVKLVDKESKKDLGTYLVGVYFNLVNRPEWQPNRITHNGTTWDLNLRFRRYYKPYTVKLKDVSKTDYAGTDTPRDYRSIIQLVDTANNTDFEKHIWMNNPLRYAGETFYQTNYSPPDPRTGKEKTTLSVVQNTGWMIPYVSCMIVAVGMLAHFWVILVRFVSRRFGSEPVSLGGFVRAIARLFGFADESQAAPLLRNAEPQSSGIWQFAPWVVAVLMAGFLFSKAREPKPIADEPDYAAFGKIPVLYEGRLQPFDTLAQNSLRLLSGYTTFKDQDGVRQPATRWLLDVIANPAEAAQHRVVRVDHPELQKKLGLEARSGYRYGLEEFLKELPKIAKEAHTAREKQAKFRSADERKILEFERKIGVLDLLTKTFTPPEISRENWKQDIQFALQELQMIDSRQPPLAVPPVENKDNELISSKDWETFARAWTKSYISVNLMGKDPNPAVTQLTEIMVSHVKQRRAALELMEAIKELKTNKTGDRKALQETVTAKAKVTADFAKEFNEGVEKYRSWLARHEAKELNTKKSDFEAFFNSFSPFYWSMLSYIVALLLALGGLLGFSRPLNRASFLTILVTLVVHSYAIYARYEISGRPPVTNLYSSAVFIGWGAVILSLLFEGVYRLGIGNLTGAALGAASLGIAHILSGDGDTMKVMQAVLDTQFWLWTHVTCITLGYSVTFVAGAFGMLYVAAGLFTKKLTPAFAKEIVRIVYGTICFGIFFSFVGTVLGGLWADDSWGRFWGWDPKENGALIIVLWNALVLHARWDGMVKERGLCVLAIIGNVVTSWSWFGVNELGVGLHSYGFTEGVWAALWSFWISQFLFVGLGCLSARKWRSFQAHGVATTEIAST